MKKKLIKNEQVIRFETMQFEVKLFMLECLTGKLILLLFTIKEGI